jgi:hypothetical protein
MECPRTCWSVRKKTRPLWREFAERVVSFGPVLWSAKYEEMPNLEVIRKLDDRGVRSRDLDRYFSHPKWPKLKEIYTGRAGLHLVIKSNRLITIGCDGFHIIISSVGCDWTCIILFQIGEGDFTTLIQTGRRRPTVETLELVFNEEDNYDSFSPAEIWRKYPNLKNFSLSVNGARREMKRFFKGFGKKGRFETFDLTFFNKLSDDVFLVGIGGFQGKIMSLHANGSCSLFICVFEMLSRLSFNCLWIL